MLHCIQWDTLILTAFLETGVFFLLQYHAYVQTSSHGFTQFIGITAVLWTFDDVSAYNIDIHYSYIQVKYKLVLKMLSVWLPSLVESVMISENDMRCEMV